MLKDEQMVQIIAEACLDEKALDVMILQVSELTIIADYFVIASGKSTIQVKSIVDYVEAMMAEYDIIPIRREGHQEGVWAVLDYGSIILHVFREKEREYYNLENLWGDARQIEIATV
ncbi:MAG TPA: ribosome silencing factor [Syntrophomonadaceae bacterium]|nr:ribosome silencing factor [Syntrophomonadaceae bacterium]